MLARIAALAAMGTLVVAQAAAAEETLARVSAVKGQVMVQQDGKISPLSAKTALKPGDRVVAKDGEVSLSYADGCKITLKPNAMATIGAASPCASSAGLVTATQGDSAQLFNLTWFGTALFALGVAGLLFLVLDDDDPASP